MDKQLLGREGEDRAAEFLVKEGYKILERNYRQSFGEIDIIAEDGDTLCFIEVKARITDDYGHPFEAVTRSKQRVIRKLAQRYLSEHDVMETLVRFDVIGIFYTDGNLPIIELLQDAF